MEFEPEGKIEVVNVVETAPVSVTAIKEDGDKALPYPPLRSVSMETIKVEYDLPFPNQVTSRMATPTSVDRKKGIASANGDSNRSSLMSAKEESEENIVQNQ